MTETLRQQIADTLKRFYGEGGELSWKAWDATDAILALATQRSDSAEDEEAAHKWWYDWRAKNWNAAAPEAGLAGFLAGRASAQTEGPHQIDDIEELIARIAENGRSGEMWLDVILKKLNGWRTSAERHATGKPPYMLPADWTALAYDLQSIIAVALIGARKSAPALGVRASAYSDEEVEAMALGLTKHAYTSRGMILTDLDWERLRTGCMDGMRAALASIQPKVDTVMAKAQKPLWRVRCTKCSWQGRWAYPDEGPFKPCSICGGKVVES
jgi:hypothetical protein